MKIISDIFAHQQEDTENFSPSGKQRYEMVCNFFISEWSGYNSREEHNLLLLVLLQRTHEGGLLGVGLEPSVTKLGSCVNELEIDLLQGSLLGVSQQGLPESEDPLLRPNTAALHHQETLLHFAVVRKATHGVDRLVGEIVVGTGVVLHQLKEKNKIEKCNIKYKGGNVIPYKVRKIIAIFPKAIGMNSIAMLRQSAFHDGKTDL